MGLNRTSTLPVRSSTYIPMSNTTNFINLGNQNYRHSLRMKFSNTMPSISSYSAHTPMKYRHGVTYMNYVDTEGLSSLSIPSSAITEDSNSLSTSPVSSYR